MNKHSNALRIAFSLAVAAIMIAVNCSYAEGSSSKNSISIKDVDGKLRIEIDGKLFTEYHYKDVPRPFFYPVIGPTGKPMTRNWPMKEGKDEQQDHVHHRSLWFTHGDVNGVDFWSEKDDSGKIVHEKLIGISSASSNGKSSASFEVQNNWLSADGKLVCTETRAHKITKSSEGIFLDFDISINASQGKLVFGDTKEGSMAIRLAPTMRLRGDVGQGHIVNSAGDREKDTWGKRAAWCDYYGPINGKTVGVAIFDHPDNPRHPTWWHVRDYGLFAANMFGVHYFEEKEKGAGDFTVPAGKSLDLKYRFYFHKGDEKQAKVAEVFKEYTKE